MSEHDQLIAELREKLDEYNRATTREILADLLAEEEFELEIDLSDYVTQNELEEALAGVDAGDVDLSNYVTRSELEDTLDELVAGLEDSLENGGSGELDELADELRVLIDRANRTLDEFETVSGIRGEKWRIGPSFSDSDAALMHNLATWGNHFTTENGMYVGDVEILAGSSGTVTFGLYEFDSAQATGPGRIGAAIDTHTVELSEGLNEVHLGLYAPRGEYLLTRPVPDTREDASSSFSNFHDDLYEPDNDVVELGAQNYAPADDDSRAGVTYHGKLSPLWGGSSTPYLFMMSNVEVYAGGSEDYYNEINN